MPALPMEAEARKGGGQIAYNLAGIAVIVLLLVVGLAYAIDQAGRPGDVSAAPGQETITQTIAGRDLTIPESWYRYGEQMRPGFVNQIDLEMGLVLPGIAAPLPVTVTLVPRSRARASSVLLDAVYLHQFDDGMVGGVPGLVGKPLKANGSYAGETVWYDALSPHPFVAKCAAPVEPGKPQRCLRTVVLPSGLAAIYGFDSVALRFWHDFDAAMERWLGPIGAL
ncbi:MAG: hypothetical protein KIS86_10115 [Devosia sp.]|nr:hypothetical protein [Devosia sp.]